MHGYGGKIWIRTRVNVVSASPRMDRTATACSSHVEPAWGGIGLGLWLWLWIGALYVYGLDLLNICLIAGGAIPTCEGQD